MIKNSQVSDCLIGRRAPLRFFLTPLSLLTPTPGSACSRRRAPLVSRALTPHVRFLTLKSEAKGAGRTQGRLQWCSKPDTQVNKVYTLQNAKKYSITTITCANILTGWLCDFNFHFPCARDPLSAVCVKAQKDAHPSRQ